MPGFGPAVDSARIGVYAQLPASRLAESGHAGSSLRAEELQRNQVQRIGHLPLMRSASELRRTKRTYVGRTATDKAPVQCPGNLALEDEHGADRQTTVMTSPSGTESHRCIFANIFFHDSGVLSGQGNGPRNDGPLSCRSGSYFRTVSLPAVATDSASMTSPLVARP